MPSRQLPHLPAAGAFGLARAAVLLRGTTYGTSPDATGGYEDETASSHDGQPRFTPLLAPPRRPRGGGGAASP